MELVDYDLLAGAVRSFLVDWVAAPFPFGLLLGAALEILGYGIFKAVSLLNIK